jgi:hypothetical protein
VRNLCVSLQTWCPDLFYKTPYDATLFIARFAITAYYRPKFFARGTQNVILKFFYDIIELPASNCLVRFKVRCSLFPVFLNTISHTYKVGLLSKVHKEGGIICCLFVLHTTLSTSINIVIIFYCWEYITIVVLLALPVFVPLDNDDKDRHSKVQCHLTPLTSELCLVTVEGIHEKIILNDVATLEPTSVDQKFQTLSQDELVSLTKQLIRSLSFHWTVII